MPSPSAIGQRSEPWCRSVQTSPATGKNLMRPPSTASVPDDRGHNQDASNASAIMMFTLPDETALIAGPENGRTSGSSADARGSGPERRATRNASNANSTQAAPKTRATAAGPRGASGTNSRAAVGG